MVVARILIVHAVFSVVFASTLLIALLLVVGILVVVVVVATFVVVIVVVATLLGCISILIVILCQFVAQNVTFGSRVIVVFSSIIAFPCRAPQYDDVDLS